MTLDTVYLTCYVYCMPCSYFSAFIFMRLYGNFFFSQILQVSSISGLNESDDESWVTEGNIIGINFGFNTVKIIFFWLLSI